MPLVSGKAFVVQVVGEVPPGLTDEQVGAMVLAGISTSLSLQPLLRGATCNIVPDTDVGPLRSGPTLVT